MPVKSQGKSKYPPLTEKEKKEIIARHKDLVDKFNAILPEGQKVSYDKNILKRLNDPKEVALYRIGNEMKQVEEKQDKIRADLEARFGKYSGTKTNPFARNFSYYLRVDDTEEARKYNEKLYDDYLHHPDRLAYVRYKDVLKINPKEILECKNDKAKLAEYYKKNYSALKDGFAFGSCFNRVDSTQGMKDGFEAIKDQLNYMGRIEKEVVYVGASYDHFAMPKITKEQGQILADNAGEFIVSDQGNTTFVPYVQTQLEKGSGDIFTLFENMEKKGAELGEGSIVKYKPISKDKYNGYEKEVDIGYILENDPENADPKVDYKVKTRTDDEIKRIQLMTSDASYIYANEWRKRFQQKTSLDGSFDPKRYESRLQRGFFSRMFTSDSRQYQLLMKQLKDFNDPNSKDYLNEDKLREAANNYRGRKANQGFTGQGKSLDDRRMKFADDIIATCDQCKEEKDKIFKEIDSEMFHGYPPKKVPFLSSEDVEEKEYDYKVEEKELNKEIDFEKDINDISLQ